MTNDLLYLRMPVLALALAEEDCRTLHQACAPGCLLSINRNDANTECVVKVTGATQAWLDGRSWAGLVTQTYTRETRSQILAVVCALTWAVPTPIGGGVGVG